MARRILNIFLAFAVFCTSFSISVLSTKAETNYETTATIEEPIKTVVIENVPILIVENVQAKEGDTIEVPIMIDNNPGVCFFGIKIIIPEGLTLISYSDGAILSNPLHAPLNDSGIEGPATYNMTWDDSLEANSNEGVLTTLTFKVAEDILPGEYIVDVEAMQGGIIDVNLDEIEFTFNCGIVKVIEICDHSFTNYVSDGNATYTQDGTKTAKCDKCDATDTIVDEGSKISIIKPNQNSNIVIKRDESEDDNVSDGEVTGESIVEGIKIGNTVNEVVEMLEAPVENIVIQNAKGEILDDNKKVGTGSKIILYSDGEIVDVVTIVITGEVDGDGEINAKDTTLMRRKIAGGWNVDTYDESLDINKDGKVDAKDTTLLRRYIAGGWNVEM